MKQCPACNRTYDDSQSFCLMDGTSLAIESEEKTIVMQPPSTRKKSKFLLWLGLTGLIILAGIGVAAGLLFYNFSRQGESVRGEKRQTGVNLPPSPKLTPTLKVTPTPASAKSSPVEESSPEVEESKPTPSNADTEDITPIAWDTMASGFNGEAGQTYTFRCPEEGTEHSIYGSDVYTDYSSICIAAVHAGLFTLEQGGTVTIEYRPGRSIYGSTVRNGIKSNTAGEHTRSFVVR